MGKEKLFGFCKWGYNFSKWMLHTYLTKNRL